MKKISLLAALLAVSVSSPAYTDAFNGGYAGIVAGFKTTNFGKFDTGISVKPSTRKNGLTGGLSLGWGGEIASNVYLGLHIDMTVGSGGKKVETKGKRASSAEAYVPVGPGAAAGGFVGHALIGPGAAAAGGADPTIYPAGMPVIAPGAATPYKVVYANAVAAAGATNRAAIPLPVGTVRPDIIVADLDDDGVIAMANPDDLGVKETISVKNSCSITPMIQFGYLSKAALAGKDMLVYGEVGPHIAFTKLSIESKITTAGIMRIRHAAPVGAAALPVVYAEAFDGVLEKKQKSSTDLGFAAGFGMKVAVSQNMVMSLGYRFTKVRGQNKLQNDKIKLPSQSHTILWGLGYSW